MRSKLIWERGLRYWFLKLPAHKTFEIGFKNLREYVLETTRFGIQFRLDFTGRDHAGLKFNLCIFKFFFEFNLVDTRHWNWQENRWRTKDEAEKDACDESQDTNFIHPPVIEDPYVEAGSIEYLTWRKNRADALAALEEEARLKAEGGGTIWTTGVAKNPKETRLSEGFDAVAVAKATRAESELRIKELTRPFRNGNDPEDK